MNIIVMIINVATYVLAAMAILGWGSVIFCWCLFGYAKYKGFLTDDITPAQILDRIKFK